MGRNERQRPVLSLLLLLLLYTGLTPMAVGGGQPQVMVLRDTLSPPAAGIAFDTIRSQAAMDFPLDIEAAVPFALPDGVVCRGALSVTPALCTLWSNLVVPQPPADPAVLDFTITLFADSGTGAPGSIVAQWCNQTLGMPANCNAHTSSSMFTFAAAGQNVVLTLPANVTLQTGPYWLSVQSNMAARYDTATMTQNSLMWYISQNATTGNSSLVIAAEAPLPVAQSAFRDRFNTIGYGWTSWRNLSSWEVTFEAAPHRLTSSHHLAVLIAGTECYLPAPADLPSPSPPLAPSPSEGHATEPVGVVVGVPADASPSPLLLLLPSPQPTEEAATPATAASPSAVPPSDLGPGEPAASSPLETWMLILIIMGACLVALALLLAVLYGVRKYRRFMQLRTGGLTLRQTIRNQSGSLMPIDPADASDTPIDLYSSESGRPKLRASASVLFGNSSHSHSSNSSSDSGDDDSLHKHPVRKPSSASSSPWIGEEVFRTIPLDGPSKAGAPLLLSSDSQGSGGGGGGSSPRLVRENSRGKLPTHVTLVAEERVADEGSGGDDDEEEGEAKHTGVGGDGMIEISTA